jgi:Uma2 family endonuclease
VWIIDPKKRTAFVHTSPEQSEQIGIDGRLDGKDVLPGFAVSLAELFKTVDQMLGLS